MERWEPTCTVEALRARAGILGAIRRFFEERDVLEVQTPTLGRTSVSDTEIESLRTTGGEFLQTSPEYYMKRLLAAGAPSIYQIGPAYRAGESGRLHLTEFTLVEWYRPGFDDDTLMAEVAGLVDAVLGPEPYRRLTHAQLLATRQEGADEPDLRLVEAVENLGEGRVFITDYPAEQAALARLRPNDPRVAARFELVIDGLELANGYHELTDAEELLERMQRDNLRRRQRGKPQMEP
ncbi:MAG: EF-P lysine aminoacylase GenX, partial [Rhodospirillales bacterium]|nr:EF-P lysine aminoacylase GenX [Rhodospirillales bacterium]